MAIKIEKKHKKKKRTVEPLGVAHIKATFNNTHITLSDQYGNVVAWWSPCSHPRLSDRTVHLHVILNGR